MEVSNPKFVVLLQPKELSSHCFPVPDAINLDYFKQYFPALSDLQATQLAQLQDLYADWNAKINVISRQDIENLNERHVLHSLTIGHYFTFEPGAHLLDLGTGGGFPGIPLAIMFPETKFTLIDSTGKKIKVVTEIANALELKNVIPLHARAEELKMPGQFDFVVTRAVAPLQQILTWSRPLIKRKHIHAYPNGIIALKGGDLKAEINAMPGKSQNYVELMPLREHFDIPYFLEKFVVYVQS